MNLSCLETNISSYLESVENIRFFYSYENADSYSLSNDILYLIVSDTMNHCIRIIDVKNKIVKTLMGTCGTSGFADGYRTIGLFNMPKNLGIDR